MLNCCHINTPLNASDCGVLLNEGNSKENSVSDQSVYPISRTIRVFFHGVTEDVSAV